MIIEKIAELQAEMDLYCALRNDFILSRMPVKGIHTDFIYQEFCKRHPEVRITQKKFAWIMCKEFNLRSVQSCLEGKRWYFYESCD